MKYPMPFGVRGLLSLASALAVTLVCQAQVSARNLFVSPSGDGSAGDSWAHAWKDPSQIDWTQVVAGDQLLVDGGTSGITYTTSFSIPVSGIVIRQATGAKHNGQVVFTGGSTQPLKSTGVRFVGSNIHLVGNTRSGIKITGYGAECVNIQTDNNSLRNVELGAVTGFPPYGGGKVAELTFGGHNNHFMGCDFRDFFMCALEKPVAGVENSAVFRNCTLGSNSYGFFGANAGGLVGSKTTPSIATTIYADNCVFGPYVDYGVDFSSGRLQLSNCLFLGARVANLNVSPPAGANTVATVSQCTFYEKKLTFMPLPYGIPEYTIQTNGTGKVKVSNSIVYGGNVNVPATQNISAGGNVQFAVTGNTTTLAPTLVDPQFVDNATLSAPSTPVAFIPRTLTSLDFTPAAGSPALGKGSPFGKVSNLVAPYGPTYGLPSNVGGP
ncbi:MAG: hypothetical protein JST01_19125 [Cyanobacteria bacterium SZAS TMP-1]|nr:hypothetical protein [Cyanobacteria bacterium SZAS TMP-1]